MGAVRGSLEELLDAGVDKLFLPHNVGHFLGLDVHDMSGTGPVPVVLQERHVVTVEPGLYLIPALLLPALEDEGVKGLLDDKVVRSMMHVGGVRIEDNVVVTGDGICNLTSAPKTIAEIEALRE